MDLIENKIKEYGRKNRNRILDYEETEYDMMGNDWERLIEGLNSKKYHNFSLLETLKVFIKTSLDSARMQ